MAVCCICNKSRAFEFSPELKRCKLCGNAYHIDCHNPPLSVGYVPRTPIVNFSNYRRTPTDFTCGLCPPVPTKDGSEKPPCKRPRLEQDAPVTSSPIVTLDPSWNTSNGYREFRITKRGAISALRRQHPNDRSLLDLLDRYANKDASHPNPLTSQERAIVNNKINGIAKQLARKSLESYNASISPPKPLRRSPAPQPSETPGLDPQRQSSLVQVQNEAQENVSKNFKVSITPRGSTSQTLGDGPSAIITPKVYRHSKGAVIDLTNDNESVASLEHDNDKTAKHSGRSSRAASPTSQANSKLPASHVDRTKKAQGKSKTKQVAASASSGSQSTQAQDFEGLKTVHRALMGRAAGMWQRIGELELVEQSSSVTIHELREEVSNLKSRLSRAQQELKSRPAIETSLPSNDQKLFLSMKQSQGDYPPIIISPESDTPSGMLPATAIEDSNREYAQLQSKLEAQEWKAHEQQQKIRCLERELEQVKADKRVSMIPFAHTEITHGMPLGIHEALSGKPSPKPFKISRKQTTSKINMHRAFENRTKLQVEPIRWNARDQGDQFRPRMERTGLDGSNDQQSARMLNSPATSGSRASSDDKMDVSDDDSCNIRSQTGGGGKAAATDDMEIPNSSNEPSATSQEVEHATSAQGAASDLLEADGTEVRLPDPKHVPEAVRAARTFARSFELDADAMPVVSEHRLAFRTSGAERSSRWRYAQNDTYRVGRDVLGEMR